MLINEITQVDQDTHKMILRQLRHTTSSLELEEEAISQETIRMKAPELPLSTRKEAGMHSQGHRWAQGCTLCHPRVGGLFPPALLHPCLPSQG